MAVKFIHFLIAITFLTCSCILVTITNLLQSALQECPNFSHAIIRQGHWTEMADFIDQVPVKKLAYMFLMQNSSSMLLILLCFMNGLFIIGYVVQWVLFATCTVNEMKVTRETTLQFFVFRLIFLGSILESGSRGQVDEKLAPGSGATREVCIWLIWFAVIGFMRWFLVLLRERFQSAQASPHATVNTFIKYLIIASGFTALNILIGAIILIVFKSHTTWTVLSLLLFENVVLIASCFKIIYRYSLQIHTLQKDQPWEERGSSLYYADMTSDVVIQLITLAHLLHIWSHYGFSFSLIDLFLFLHVRQMAVGVYRNLVAMRTYAKAIAEINDRFPDATAEELRIADDVCSICRDSMESAKKLSCGHMFHRACVQQWIEHQSFCPSCRAPILGLPQRPTQPRQPAANNANNVVPGLPPVAGAVLAQQQAAIAHYANQHRLQQQAAMSAALAASALHHQQQQQQLGLGGGGLNSAGSVASPSSLHSVGMRNRFNTSSASTTQPGSTVSGPTPSASSSIPAQSPVHVHGSNTTQPLFRIDTSRFPWLPNFSLEVQARREDLSIPIGGAPAHTEHLPPGYEDMPPLESIEASSTSSAIPPTPVSLEEMKEPLPAATPSVSSPTASSSSVSLREKIYLATQRRLESENVARDAATATNVSPSAIASSSSSSSYDDIAVPDDESTLPQPTLPSTSSPLLLSQADADANLARELQYEEQLLAQEAEQQRRNGGGGFSRFFATL